MSELWDAPVARGAVDATVTLPGSKSLTNRALVLAALADGPSTIGRPLRARDTELMAAALRALGTGVTDTAEDGWRVTPAPFRGPAQVDCGLAGTVMRFVPPLAALAHGDVTIDGDPRARERPMGPVVTALRQLGVAVDDGGRGALPFTVHGVGAVRGGAVTVDASTSSQFVSALLLVGARFTQGVTVRHVGPAVPSRPHIAMTMAMLRDAGVAADEPATDVWQVRPGPVRARDLLLEADIANALPFAAAALATGGRVRLVGWPRGSDYQPDAESRALLTALGARLEDTPDGLVVSAAGRPRGTDLDLRRLGEQVPVVAALAALAQSPTTIRGVAHLRGHETDRLAALTRELTALGTGDGLEIRPRRLHGGVFRTYDDHRLATAAAVLGLVVPGVQVEDVGTTGKTFPGFVTAWTAMVTG
ncbi:MAG: 3-phosphoshikimate 1-carboxyvinyltransferase [Actinomycetia bacterium]|nr:3-phosphoshikimate 1-carboxyvinyltransferase [Actinomycetes bacterium]